MLTEIKSALISLTFWLMFIACWKYCYNTGSPQSNLIFLAIVLICFFIPFFLTIFLNYKNNFFRKLRFVYLLFTHLNILSVLPMMFIFTYESWINFIALFMGGIFRFSILVMDYAKVPVMIDNHIFLNSKEK